MLSDVCMFGKSWKKIPFHYSSYTEKKRQRTRSSQYLETADHCFNNFMPQIDIVYEYKVMKLLQTPIISFTGGVFLLLLGEGIPAAMTCLPTPCNSETQCVHSLWVPEIKSLKLKCSDLLLSPSYWVGCGRWHHSLLVRNRLRDIWMRFEKHLSRLFLV